MKNFIKQHKYHLIVLTILLVIAGISGYKYWIISNSQFPISNELPIFNEIQNTNEQITDNAKQSADNSYQITEQETLPSDSSTTTYDLQPTADNLPLTTYELKANSYNLTPTSTVYNLMQFASADSRQSFLFETKDYGSMGLFIESINGLKNNNQTGEYWIYYVNGESAKIGISNYIVKPGDIIKWSYEKSNF